MLSMGTWIQRNHGNLSTRKHGNRCLSWELEYKGSMGRNACHGNLSTKEAWEVMLSMGTWVQRKQGNNCLAWELGYKGSMGINAWHGNLSTKETSELMFIMGTRNLRKHGNLTYHGYLETRETWVLGTGY